LVELNEGSHLNFFNEKDMNDELLRADLERIYATTLIRYKNRLYSYYLNDPDKFQLFTSSIELNVPLENMLPFEGMTFSPSYTDSPFYIEGRSDKIVEEWIAQNGHPLDVKTILEDYNSMPK